MSMEYLNSLRQELEDVEYTLRCNKIERFNELKKKMDAVSPQDRFAFICFALNVYEIDDPQMRMQIVQFFDTCEKKYGFNWRFNDLNEGEQEAILRMLI